MLMNWRHREVGILHYLDQRADSAEREIAFRWQAMQEELDRRIHSVDASAQAAAGELSKRLDGMNEFRSALSDQIAHTVTREMFDAGMASQSERFEALTSVNSGRLDRIEGILDRQRGRQAAYAAIAAVAGVLITIFIIVAGHIHVA